MYELFTVWFFRVHRHKVYHSPKLDQNQAKTLHFLSKMKGRRKHCLLYIIIVLGCFASGVLFIHQINWNWEENVSVWTSSIPSDQIAYSWKLKELRRVAWILSPTFGGECPQRLCLNEILLSAIRGIIFYCIIWNCSIPMQQDSHESPQRFWQCLL